MKIYEDEPRWLRMNKDDFKFRIKIRVGIKQHSFWVISYIYMYLDMLDILYLYTHLVRIKSSEKRVFKYIIIEVSKEC